MFSLLLLLMTENVHAYTPHEVFIFNEIQSQQWRMAAVFQQSLKYDVISEC